MEIPFVKLQGNGNDFILIDEIEGEIIPDAMKGEFSAQYCDRRFGIGGDGVLFIQKSTTADIRMRLFQPDRSEATMCGNGIRCFVKYAVDMGYFRDACRVETPAGIIPVRMGYRDDRFIAAVDMPTPLFLRKDIPANGDGEYLEQIDGFEVRAVNIGVPHAVIIVDNVDVIDLPTIGPRIRRHPTFPQGANVNFVQKTGNKALSIRTFERGVEEETFSCGTGATASAVILHRMGVVEQPVEVETSGGPLTIYLKEGVVMEGSAETVFWGAIVF